MLTQEQAKMIDDEDPSERVSTQQQAFGRQARARTRNPAATADT